MKRSLLFLVVIGLVAMNTIASGADFPSKPIKIFVHTKPGGAVDLMARQLAQVATNYCDQPLVVINKPGGSGLLVLADVYKSKPDGYTLLAFPAAFLAPLPLELLPLEDEVRQMLHTLGIHTLGDFAALPPPSVGRRWNQGGVDYLRGRT